MKKKTSEDMKNLVIAVDALRCVDAINIRTILSNKQAATLCHATTLINQVAHALAVEEMGGVRAQKAIYPINGGEHEKTVKG